jgi:hypothetical protein
MSLYHLDGFSTNGFPKSCILKAKSGRQGQHERNRMPLAYELHGFKQYRQVLRQLAVPAARK